jgi:3-oxoacyl-[acyl-carrier protein] reductase
MAEEPLQGKVAIITGAASPIGLGHAMTVALVRAGARVALLDINDAWLAQSAAESTAARSGISRKGLKWPIP